MSALLGTARRHPLNAQPHAAVGALSAPGGISTIPVLWMRKLRRPWDFSSLVLTLIPGLSRRWEHFRGLRCWCWTEEEKADRSWARAPIPASVKPAKGTQPLQLPASPDPSSSQYLSEKRRWPGPTQPLLTVDAVCTSNYGRRKSSSKGKLLFIGVLSATVESYLLARTLKENPAIASQEDTTKDIAAQLHKV